ncbi:hypothetical protein [Eubacterium ramulus]
MIEKITDVKLNVRPVFIGLVHQYYYEGHAVSEKAKNWRRTMMYL